MVDGYSYCVVILGWVVFGTSSAALEDEDSMRPENEESSCTGYFLCVLIEM